MEPRAIKATLAVVTVTCLLVMSAAVFYHAVEDWAGNLILQWKRPDTQTAHRDRTTRAVTFAIFGLVWVAFTALIAALLDV